MSIFGLCNLPRDTINRLYGDQNGELIPKNNVHPDFSQAPVIPKLPETVQSIIQEQNEFNHDQIKINPVKVHESPKTEEAKNSIENADNPINDISFKDYAEKQAQTVNDASKILIPASDIKIAQTEILNKDPAKRAYLC